MAARTPPMQPIATLGEITNSAAPSQSLPGDGPQEIYDFPLHLTRCFGIKPKQRN